MWQRAQRRVEFFFAFKSVTLALEAAIPYAAGLDQMLASAVGEHDTACSRIAFLEPWVVPAASTKVLDRLRVLRRQKRQGRAKIHLLQLQKLTLQEDSYMLAIIRSYSWIAKLIANARMH
jgi:hypothetical protein